ncbi:MAG: sulfotransferase [Sphingobium sp.]
MSNRHDIRLDLQCLLDIAQQETGLADFDDDDLPNRAGMAVEAYRRLDLPALTQEKAAESILDIMVTRLRMTQDRKDYPGIAEETIAKPIVVAGFPRSGTTLLYSLLAADPQARSPHWWDALHPTPPVGLSPEHDVLRKQIAHREVAEFLRVNPIKPAHNFFYLGADMILECYMLWGLDFRALSPFLYFRVPAHPSLDPGGSSLNLGADMVAAYAFEKRLLQTLQWRRPTGHWVLKDPTNQFYLPEMQQVFPDATFVWPHRDPVQMFASVVELTCLMTGGVAGVEIDRKVMAKALLDLFAAGLDRVLDHPIVDSPAVVHVAYRDMTGDMQGFAAKLYDRIGRDFTPQVAANIDAYRNDPRNRADLYGKFQYSLENTGLSADQVREAFGPYIEKFDVPVDNG